MDETPAAPEELLLRLRGIRNLKFDNVISVPNFGSARRNRQLRVLRGRKGSLGVVFGQRFQVVIGLYAHHEMRAAAEV